MQFRIIGVCVTMASSFIAAYYSVKNLKYRLRVSRALLDFAEFVKIRILMFRQPIPEIISEYDGETLSRMGFISGINGSDLLSSAENCGLYKYLNENSTAAFKSFSSKIGKTDAEEQGKYCDVLINVLSKEIEKTESDLPNKTRVYSSLCVIAGLAVSLLIFT